MDSKSKLIFSQNSSINDIWETLQQINSSQLGLMFNSQNKLSQSQDYIPSQNFATQGEDEKPSAEVLALSDPHKSPQEKDVETFSFKNEDRNGKSASKITEAATPSKGNISKPFQKENGLVKK